MSIASAPPQVDRAFASLSQQVYLLLKDSIMSLDLPPGSRLNESDLAKRMGTSVTPVREALRSLEGEGLVELSYSRSGVVVGLSLDDIRDLYEVRMVLETWAVRNAVSLVTQEDLDELRETVRRAEESLNSGDLSGFSRNNRQFHRMLYQRAGNALLVKVLDGIADQVHRVVVAREKQAWAAIDKHHMELDQHRAIIKALEVRDAELAAISLRQDIAAVLNDLDAGNLDSLALILSPQRSDDSVERL
jgi:DNA-binding GntR family transcriptional regulator